jgi:cobalt/nickel transport system ATP-binding protein
MSLSTHTLTFSYQTDQPVLHDLSLDFSRGQVIGLLGANGCGKSTLFMNLLGIQKPQQGKVCWNGEALNYDKRSLHALRQKIAMVFQDPDQQIFYTDVVSDIAFSLRNLGMDESIIQSRIDQALALVDATAFRDKPIQYLSHGQKKRVAIAGALVMESEYLQKAPLYEACLQSYLQIMLMELLRTTAAKKILSSEDLSVTAHFSFI